MKKLFAALLCTLSMGAYAADYGIGLQYDYEHVNSNAGRLQSISKQGVLVGARTSYGLFDAGVYNLNIKGEAGRYEDNNLGVEVGYGIGHSFSNKVSLSSRVAYGRLFGRGLGADETTGDYTTLFVAVGYPITPTLNASVGYRRRFEGDFDGQNQYSLNLRYSISKNYELRGSFYHSVQTGRQGNGAAATLIYFF